MEAPEKIYVVDATFPDYVDFDGSPINTKKIDDHDIEYTRTDAFIERACEFLNSSSILRNTHIVERFKEYMKGE